MNVIVPPAASQKWTGYPPLDRLPDLRPEIMPYPFQDWTLAKSATQPRFAIGAATGLGKTFMSYEAWKRYRLLHPGTRALILTNKSAALQFVGEHAKFYSSTPRATAVYDKMPKFGQKKYADTRKQAYAMFAATTGEQLDFLVLNYHLFRQDILDIEAAVRALTATGTEMVLITDEATAFKNRATATHRSVNTIALLSSKVIILTATLTKGKLEQVYGIFAAVGLGPTIAPHWEAFLAEFCVCSQSRNALVKEAKLKEVYYYIVQNGLDDGLILGFRAFCRRFDIKVTKGVGRVSRHDLTGIWLLCRRSPVFQAQVPDKDAFHLRLEVQYEEVDKAVEPVITGYRNMDTFIQRIAPYVVILTKADAADFLPPFVPRLTLLEHTPEQRRLIHDIYVGEVQTGDFAEMEKDMGVGGEASGLLTVPRLTEQGHIRRALLDPRLVHKQRLDDLSAKAHAPKTEELLRFLRDEATGERIIVYTPSKAHLLLLAATIRHAEGLEDWYADPLEIHGDIKTAERERSRVLFQTSPDHRLILLNEAGIESLNLQAASILVAFGLPRSGGDMIQLAGRLSRLGSTHQSLMVNYLLIDESQDMDDYDVIMKQMQVVSLVMGEAEKGLLDHERLRSLDGVSSEVSDETYKRASLAHLVLGRRSRRMRSYGVALPG